MAHLVKNPPAMQEMQEKWVWFLGWDDPLEKAMATHSSIFAWRNPWTEEPGRLQFMGLQRVRHDWACTHGSSIFSFLRNLIQFSTVIALIYISNISSQMFLFLQILANICYLWSVFHDRHSDKCEVISHCGFDLHFPDD